MKVKPIFTRAGVALAIFFLTGSARAEEARLPYHKLYTVQKAQSDWNAAHTNLIVAMIMESTQPGVKSSDLAIYIDSKSGKIPVEIRPAGDFTLPMRDDLLAEDPWIITNQPKGTMKLAWQVGVIPGRIAKSVHYARLMRPVRESEGIQEQMRQFFPNSPRLNVTGLKMTFPPADKNAAAVIHARGGDRKLAANENGEVILPLSPDLMEEDPEITLSSIPESVAIVSRKMEK